jgi:hypothetical protein
LSELVRLKPRDRTSQTVAWDGGSAAKSFAIRLLVTLPLADARRDVGSIQKSAERR